MRFLNLQYDICGGPFCDCGLGYLLPRYSPKVLGRRVKTNLIATHPKLTCAQTKAPLLKLWWHAYGKGNCYKRVMAGRYNITTIKGSMLTVNRKAKNMEWNKRLWWAFFGWIRLGCLLWYWVLIFWVRELRPVQLQLNLVRLVRKLCLVCQENTYSR